MCFVLLNSLICLFVQIATHHRFVPLYYLYSLQVSTIFVMQQVSLFIPCINDLSILCIYNFTSMKCDKTLKICMRLIVFFMTVRNNLRLGTTMGKVNCILRCHIFVLFQRSSILFRYSRFGVYSSYIEETHLYQSFYSPFGKHEHQLHKVIYIGLLDRVAMNKVNRRGFVTKCTLNTLLRDAQVMIFGP